VLMGGPNGQASGSTVTVNYATSDVTATAGSDYTSVSGTLSFAPGQTVKTVVVPIADDASAEPLESFSLSLSSVVNASIADGTGTIVIGASDAPALASPAISVPADVVVGEGDGFADVAVRLSAPGSSTVAVSYVTGNSTASGGTLCNNEFVPVGGTLIFAPGETTKVVRVDLNDCAAVQGFSAFTFALNMPGNATIQRASVRIGIIDNDNVVATPRLYVRDAVVDEKDGSALVEVLLGGSAGQASTGTVTVNYATTGITATAGSDYSSVSGTLSFAPGQTAKTVVVPIADDATAEPSENFAFTLSSATNASIADGTGTIAIGASDAPAVASPAVSVPADVLVGEGDGFVDVGVRLSAPGSSAVSVDYATAGSTASGGTLCNNEFVSVGGTLNFAPGETTKVVRVDLNDCAAVQGFSSFTFGLSGAVNATIPRPSVRVGIVDNDRVATPRLFVRDAVVDEKDGNALVEVLLGGPGGQASASTVTVDYATGDGTATAGTDYTAVSGTLGFAPGQTVKTIVVPIADDATAESAENFHFSLSNAVNASITNGTGTVVIGASDSVAVAQPRASAPADLIVGEGDGYVDLAVRLSDPSSSLVSVNYATAGSTASGGTLCNNEFVSVSGTLNFAPGETTKSVRVDLNECAALQGFTSFTFGLSGASNATIQRTSTRIGIIDNDNVVATPGLIIRDATVDEKDGVALVPVILGGTRGQASASTVTVDYASSDGTATAGSDYTAVSGTLTFAPGQTVQTIVVPIADDAVAEPSETVSLNLSNAINATIGDGTSLVVIGASDAAAVATPSIAAGRDVIVRETDGYVDLPVRLSAPGSSMVSVDYATANATATAGTLCNNDYVGASGTLNFAPGETTKVVRVDIDNCVVIEPLETFTLQLSGAVNGTITRASGRILIIDDTGSVTGIAVAPLTVQLPLAAKATAKPELAVALTVKSASP
jgi:hypothetical protein